MAAGYFYRLLIITAVTTTTLQISSFPGNTEELEKMKKLAEIKVRILNKIGLRDRPLLVKPTNRLDKLRGRIKNKENKSPGEYYAEIQEIVSHSQLPENKTDENVIQFKVVRDTQGRKLEVTSANLLVKIKYKRNKRGAGRRRKKLKLKKISLKLSNVDSNGKPVNVVSSITTKIRRTKWLKVPVPAKIIENAMQRDDQILYLHLNCEGCDKTVKLILINGKRRKSRRKRLIKKKKNKKGKMRELQTRRRRRKRRLNRTRPFLILHTKIKTYIRSKRDTITCTNNSTCCMEHLRVDFAALGWSDWVIAPAGFQTGVCQGTCSNSHTCSETKSKNLSILFIDQNRNIILKSLRNMIVTECGCGLITK